MRIPAYRHFGKYWVNSVIIIIKSQCLWKYTIIFVLSVQRTSNTNITHKVQRSIFKNMATKLFYFYVYWAVKFELQGIEKQTIKVVQYWEFSIEPCLHIAFRRKSWSVRDFSWIGLHTLTHIQFEFLIFSHSIVYYNS